ncbi:uncharacterized protein RAG0_03741 [Rhynchosporium agropyri]|uniref:Uncharacterized protein n=1 Tax=Rhynchosporium agropyri TaxID=914238 RepID=A0A1E1K9X4_9HELO|nr:uncharacterized protein RAG0_03741 [Rhynchosporium agropyri]
MSSWIMNLLCVVSSTPSIASNGISLAIAIKPRIIERVYVRLGKCDAVEERRAGVMLEGTAHVM